MADVSPKIKFYILLFVFSLLFNYVIVISAYAINQERLNESDYISKEALGNAKFNESVNATFRATISTGTAFLPFIDLINLATLNLDYSNPIISIFAILYGIVVLILGILKTLLILAIIMNFTPKILGSGFDT